MGKRQDVRRIVRRLRKCVSELEELYPGRRFTLDGHLVGSLGECYGFELLPVGTKVHDAVAGDRMIQIKTTQRNSIGLSHEPEYLLVLRMEPNGTFTEIYYGPGGRIWDLVKGKKRPRNGQYRISLSNLAKKMRSLQNEDDSRSLP